MQQTTGTKTSPHRSYHRTRMQRDLVIERLRERGCRITRQRLILLDIILEEECSSCKEIFYKASCQDKNIGAATVYRMINTLEDIGAINRKNMYRIACSKECQVEKACSIELDDGNVLELSASEWYSVIQSGLLDRGYLGRQQILSVTARSCDCEEAG